MRISQFIKTFLGPLLAATTGSVAFAGSTHPQPLDPAAMWATVGLALLLALSVGTIAWSRRERRRFKRDIAQKRCSCCGNAMRGIVDAQNGPIWRCVDCMREEAALYSPGST